MASSSYPSPRPRIRFIPPSNASADVQGEAAGISPDNDVRLVADDQGHQKKRKGNSGSFLPNQSGNPAGRPKGARGAKTIVRKILLDKVTIQTARGSKKSAYFEALVKKEAALAAEGDWRARRTMFEFAKWVLGDEIVVTPNADDTSAVVIDDTGEAILAWFANEIRARDAGESQ